MPDGSQAVFTVTGDASSLAVACVALTPWRTAVPAHLTFLGEMRYDAYYGGWRNYFLATGCERRQEQELDQNEFVTVREVPLADLVSLAMTGQMTDQAPSSWPLPHLMPDPAVRELFTPAL